MSSWVSFLWVSIVVDIEHIIRPAIARICLTGKKAESHVFF